MQIQNINKYIEKFLCKNNDILGVRVDTKGYSFSKNICVGLIVDWECQDLIFGEFETFSDSYNACVALESILVSFFEENEEVDLVFFMKNGVVEHRKYQGVINYYET